MDKRFAAGLMLLPLALQAEQLPERVETIQPLEHRAGTDSPEQGRMGPRYPGLQLLAPGVGRYEKLKQVFTSNVPLRLLWKRSAEGSQYRLQIARDEAFQEVIEETVVSATQYDPQHKYLRGAYFWRVASIDACGVQGPYSETMYFEYRPIPERPDIGGIPVHIEEKLISIELPELPAGERYLLALSKDTQLKDVVWRGEALKLPLVVFKPEPGQYYLAAQSINDEGMAGPYALLPLEVK